MSLVPTNWFVLSLAIGFGTVTAQAITIASTTFNVTGTFQGGATLGGTVNINTASGAITGGDLTVSGITPDFTVLDSQGAGLNGNDYFADFLNGDILAAPAALLNLYFQSSTLVGYTGGALCSTAANCGSDVTSYVRNVDPLLTGGSVTPATSTPEPSSWMLMLVGPALFGVRRLRKTF